VSALVEDAAAPELVRRVVASTALFPSTAMNFVADDGEVDEATLASVVAAAVELGKLLRGAGLQRGDRVAIRGGAGSRAVSEAILACTLGGFVAMPLVSLLGDGDVDGLLELSEARVLLAESQIRGRDISAHLRRVRARGTILTGGIGDLATVPDLALPGTANVTATGWAGVADDDLAFVLFSSGTMGTPKGVMHSYSTVLEEVHDFADQLDLLDDGHLLQPFPLGHIGGIAGLFICAVLARDMTQLNSWNAAIAMDAIDRYGATGTGTSPYFIQTLLDEFEKRGSGLSTLRTIESGGGRVARELVLRADKLGFRLSRGYGSTEHPTVATHHASDSLEKRANSDGHVFSSSKIRILGPDGTDVPPEADGEVVISGPEQFLGYLSGDRSAFVDGGWFRTGDIGRISESGYLTITGRIKEIIIRGGENISIAEVEHLLTEHPSILEAAVVGVPDIKFGERAHAFVVCRAGAGSIDLAEIRRFFSEKDVARYKTPEWVTLVDSLPRNGLGKVQKHLLLADV
jgi:acyl-CoA synthetase (AMP-forming)/AMP-acid ligase II